MQRSLKPNAGTCNSPFMITAQIINCGKLTKLTKKTKMTRYGQYRSPWIQKSPWDRTLFQMARKDVLTSQWLCRKSRQGWVGLLRTQPLQAKKYGTFAPLQRITWVFWKVFPKFSLWLDPPNLKLETSNELSPIWDWRFSSKYPWIFWGFPAV